MARRHSPYDSRYERERRVVLSAGLPCALRLACDGARADSADHVPAIALHAHIPGSGCCRLQPACMACQHAQGHLVAHGGQQARRPVPQPSRRW